MSKKQRPHAITVKYELADAFRENSGQIFDLARSNALLEVVQDCWRQIGEQFPARDRIPATGLTCQYRPAHEGGQAVICTLPQQHVFNEASHVGLFRDQKHKPRLFVMENMAPPSHAPSLRLSAIVEIEKKSRVNWRSCRRDQDFEKAVDEILRNPDAVPQVTVDRKPLSKLRPGNTLAGKKSYLSAYLIWLFFGLTGAHRLYLKRYPTGFTWVGLLALCLLMETYLAPLDGVWLTLHTAIFIGMFVVWTLDSLLTGLMVRDYNAALLAAELASPPPDEPQPATSATPSPPVRKLVDSRGRQLRLTAGQWTFAIPGDWTARRDTENQAAVFTSPGGGIECRVHELGLHDTSLSPDVKVAILAKIAFQKFLNIDETDWQVIASRIWGEDGVTRMEREIRKKDAQQRIYCLTVSHEGASVVITIRDNEGTDDNESLLSHRALSQSMRPLRIN
ncbi:TM2 domain-containing membrane protein YozV [Fluviicoccus keumensis]|uniref:TM2 domain-containing membrane protein YozV n=1 Tax=Fluviicoccus keumensis TaxID=1435465 RepID=A0A4V2G3T0_9GAMM|nr:TM2 domain-containing protein [Fluviicoccus keumensis]RZU38216.1 TM2 domain-containing membrane protein YozV [Fluviicoccus keumensis]